MREQTKEALGWIVYGLFAFSLGYGAAKLPNKVAEPQTAGDYIETPSERTQVYKFVDDDGSKCYIAESDGGAVALQCEIAP